MSKEYLEAFRGFKNGMITNNAICITKSYFDNKFPIIEHALQRLEAIEKSKPSKALESLEYLIGSIRYFSENSILHTKYDNSYNTIKQALIKAQENEKVLETIFEKYVDLNLIDCDDEVEQYNRHFGKGRQLAQEEFDILKKKVKEDE